MTAALHPQAEQISQRLQQENVTALYHFTSIENIPTIRQHVALCSKAVLEDAGCWPVPAPGGNELSHNLDRRNNNWDKVSLSFTPRTPMVYGKKKSCHLCFFVIDPSVATWQGVQFSNTNAANVRIQRRAEGLAGLELVNFSAIQSSPRPGDRDGWFIPVQAEVLVPRRIDFSYIKEIAFISSASLQEAERLWGKHPHPKFVEKAYYFSDMPNSMVCTFCFLKKLKLTGDIIDEDTVEQEHTHSSLFSRKRTQRITAIAELYATAGASAKLSWGPINNEETYEFEKSSVFYHWPSIPISDLPTGKCSITYYLGDIRWAALDFEVRE